MAKFNRIVGRTAPNSQTCPKCGRIRGNHEAGPWVCSVPSEVTQALRIFAIANGARWKSKLTDLWVSGDETSTELQQARNMIGPDRLYKISL